MTRLNNKVSFQDADSFQYFQQKFVGIISSCG